MKCEYFVKHSRNPSIFTIVFFLLLLVMGMPRQGLAQMFSVDSPERTYQLPGTAIYLGVEPADFEFRGESLLPGNDRFSFTGSLLRLRLESRGINLFLATGGSLTGIEDASYFDAGLKAGYGLSILRQQNFGIQIPVQLTSSITTVTDRESASNETAFRQGGLVGGAGVYLFARPSGPFRVEANAIPSYGFSFATGGTFGGSLTSVEGQLRLFMDRLFDDIGISLGYDYNFRRFDVDGSQFDYDFGSHSILVGVTF